MFIEWIIQYGCFIKAPHHVFINDSNDDSDPMYTQQDANQ